MRIGAGGEEGGEPFFVSLWYEIRRKNKQGLHMSKKSSNFAAGKSTLFIQ